MHRYSFPHTPVANTDSIISAGNYRFTVLTDGLLRYEWAEDRQFEDRASVLAINRQLPVPEFRVKEDQTSLQILTSRFHLTYDKQEFSANGLSAVIKGNYGPHVSVWRYGVQSSNLGGTTRTLDEANGRVVLEKGVISRQGFATLDDSTSMLFDDRQWVTTRLPGNRLDGYLFAYGHDYRQAIQAFYLLSGPQPLLPRWALGNWWSRFYPYTGEEYLSLMDRFRDSDIPLSVAVLDMDWHIVGDDLRVRNAGVTGWTGYTWNKKLFPDPKAFLAELHDRGLHISLNDHPADGVQGYEDPYNEMATAMNHDTSIGDPIPFDITNQVFLDAFFDVLHRRFERDGLDLWWVDWQQGTHSRIPGIDPLWVLNHYHFLDSSLDNKRPLTFSRYAGPGSHRYPIGFSGDTVVTWDSLHFQPEFTATASNIGFGWWSHDIGGHFHGQKNDEMLIRWVQYGVFSPILRLHSSNNIFSIKEPWNLDPQYGQIMTEYLKFRHRLLPYLYTMNVRAAMQGLPLIQPMYWAYPESEESYNVQNQYMFGSDLIVVPITAPQDPRSRRSQVLAWLPPGRYVDVFTGMVYDGDRRIWLNRRLKDFPVFAPEGAIIPLDAASALPSDCANSTSIELLVVVGKDGVFELVEDDGKGKCADQINFRRTRITFNQQAGELYIEPRSGGNISPHVRQWKIRFLGYASSEVINVCVGDKKKMVNGQNVNNCLYLDVGSHPENTRIVIKLESHPHLMMNRPELQIIDFLRGAQIELDLKDEIRKIIERPISRLLQIGDLHALGLDSVLLNPILEFLLADSRFALTTEYQETAFVMVDT